MKPDVTYDQDNCALTIRLDNVIDSLDVEERRDLMRTIAMDGPFLEWLVQYVVKGSTDDGDWPSREFLANLQFKLIDWMDELGRKSVEVLTDLLMRERKWREDAEEQERDARRHWPSWCTCPRCHEEYINPAKMPDRKFSISKSVQDDMIDEIVKIVTKEKKL